MSENNAPEVSWSTDLSPTALFTVPGLAGDVQRVAGRQGGVPGVVREVGGWQEGYTGTHPATVPGSHIEYI